MDSYNTHPITLLIEYIKNFSLQQADFEFSCYIGGERKTIKRRIFNLKGVEDRVDSPVAGP